MGRLEVPQNEDMAKLALPLLFAALAVFVVEGAYMGRLETAMFKNLAPVNDCTRTCVHKTHIDAELKAQADAHEKRQSDHPLSDPYNSGIDDLENFDTDFDQAIFSDIDIEDDVAYTAKPAVLQKCLSQCMNLPQEETDLEDLEDDDDMFGL
mmetsp:Transcript_33622/g.78763  ORF Transcript_33622/g.78763 Transcript_33622/m.78763 type:complete len:152 (-) Transcript_33622:47-502(-)